MACADADGLNRRSAAAAATHKSRRELYYCLIQAAGTMVAVLVGYCSVILYITAVGREETKRERAWENLDAVAVDVWRWLLLLIPHHTSYSLFLPLLLADLKLKKEEGTGSEGGRGGLVPEEGSQSGGARRKW